jgi:hypothetical protein
MTDYNELVNEFDGEKSDFKAFLKALRDAIPEEDHPHKKRYTAEEILSLFDPCYVDDMCIQEVPYGTARCKCGHNISYIYYAIYRKNPCIKVEPIGSKCIKKFTILFDSANLKQILDTFPDERIYAESNYSSSWDPLSTDDFNAKNGFDKKTMTYLLHVLDPYQWAFLSDMVKKRKIVHLTFKQQNLFYSIIRRIEEVYKKGVEAKQPDYV